MNLPEGYELNRRPIIEFGCEEWSVWHTRADGLIEEWTFVGDGHDNTVCVRVSLFSPDTTHDISAKEARSIKAPPVAAYYQGTWNAAMRETLLQARERGK